MDGFSFPSAYGPPYPTFRFHPIQLLFDVLLALLLVDGLSRLNILYHNYGRCSTYKSESLWNFLVAWHRKHTSEDLIHLWILSWCHMDNISFGSFRLGLWHRAGVLWWFSGIVLYLPNQISSVSGIWPWMIKGLSFFTCNQFMPWI